MTALKDANRSFFSSAYPWLIVSMGMLFYCFNYYLRSSPSVMQNELSQTLHITAYQFGMLTSAYYWAYTPMQLPAGMLYDKFGVRVVLSIACLLGVLGLYMFVNAHTYSVAWTGRFIIGMGCAFAYIGTLKLAAVWLPPNRFATVAGLATAAGMASGALTQRFISETVSGAHIDYRVAMHPALLAGVALSLLIFFLVRDSNEHRNELHNPEMEEPMDIKQLLGAIKIIFSNPQMWLIGIIGCLLYLPASVFLDAYCKEYLMTVYSITPAQAVNIANLTFLGWIISGPIIGAFSDKIKRRCMPLSITGAIAAILLCAVFYAPHIVTVNELYIIFFMAGFCCGAHPLCFSLGKENNPLKISGTSVATTNALIMVGGMIFPPIVGKLLDMHASTIGANGLPIYTESDYTFALSVVPIGVAVGIFLSFFLKETYCEIQSSPEHDELLGTSTATIDDEIAVEDNDGKIVTIKSARGI